MSSEEKPGAGAPGPLWPAMLPPRRQGDDSLCAVSAKGVRVQFADGHERLDGSSGLWNVNLGYGNSAIAEAVSEALTSASYLSSWSFENSYTRQAAAALIELVGPEQFSRVIFSTSGGAANEVCMKIARHFHVLQNEPERKVILGLRDGFHGLTYGAFALTDAQLGQKMYGVDRRFVGHVAANDPGSISDALAKLRGRVSAIVVEPVLGTGAVPLSEEYVAELLRLRKEHGFLLVADEITTGFARIGNAMFESQCWPEAPDLVITSKALTNGTMAASAIVVSRAVAQTFHDHDTVLGHAETQSGTAVAGAAVIATIAEHQRHDSVALSSNLAKRIDVVLAELVEREPLVVDAAGRGCLRALQLADAQGPLNRAEVDRVAAAIRAAGALVHPGPSSVQLVPALIYSDDELAELVDRVSAGLTLFASEK
jgi:adenosylmethionine-8-amino-7-oxononanoate aminotransferase